MYINVNKLNLMMYDIYYNGDELILEMQGCISILKLL